DLGMVQQRAGNIAASKTAYEQAAQEFTRALSSVATAAGTDLHWGLRMAYAGLGDATRAVAEGKQGMALQPTSEDPFEGPQREDEMARIYAALGNADEALPILKRWIQVPSLTGITAGALRIEPCWDPIRNDPRFQDLISQEKGGSGK